MKYILILMFALLINGCAIFGAPTELDDTKGLTAERIYQMGEEKMRNKDYDKAIVYFGKLESRYPNGRYATQAQLETAYAHYKKQDPVLAVAAADRFIKLHPNHPNVDYAYYLKGLAVFNERGILEKLTKQQISDRDPRSLRDSFVTFKELVTRYPNSRYTKDATQRMIYLANSLSEHELDVARYYMKRQAYLAAINRCKYVLEYFPQTPGVEEALVIMISAYDLLSLDDLKNDTLRILEKNYPNSAMLGKGAPTDERVWWKFWEGLY
ncbi:outer membrane protein assembly factor BamD [Methylotenera sp.]|uniref:outer membrane protein assembly factor BamD n=1 Tax=Methylotenera sp. TaxID=2051956 RepID=UPI0027280CFF|nr:outer membrane protein assembly factor BamD [Methylotenera sp.]MDO9204292.1 outer membrane protein assembly factor BamD [Methylotenera sp.]MDO9394625.1 outer membrane protein assembly factor BamD [Methylotenera sp.]MDP1522484.1 outer membrane protein assembly factor BamD [Methylotenera sp.]MDP2071401.1 outer membrane protein assembly factor BamD [Methylotenera sp.]MDP2229866.1 outer membrane protein assembly factor BamD [Methylotenera sp.]